MEPTKRFSERADDYAVGRPSYPTAALDDLFRGLGDPARLTVVDLGAGTGISSRLLAERVACVIAVEPNEAMREAGNASASSRFGSAVLRWHAGTAERTGLPPACADVVTAFQAFHWFSTQAALDEMARILRPRGRAALVYNERDERDPFTRSYGDLARRYRTDDTESLRGGSRRAFATFTAYGGWSTVRRSEIPNEHALDREQLHARARSTSYLPKQGAVANGLHAEIDALFDQHAGAGVVVMRLKTSVALAERRAS